MNKSLEKVGEIIDGVNGVDLNEANTRHLIIDSLLHDVMSWPKASVLHEEHNDSGYSDFILYRKDRRPALVIEAKRTGKYFALPKVAIKKDKSGFVSVKVLVTDVETKSAMQQVRGYANEIGCQFCCVSNGSQWIFFRSFIPGRDWKEQNAFIISDISYFRDSFTSAYNFFSYQSVVEDSSISSLLIDGVGGSREATRPAAYVTNYDVTIGNNSYFRYLRKIGEIIFSDLSEDDPDLMDACYVSDADYNKAFSDAQSVITDAITPYLEEHGIQNSKNEDGRGEIANRIEKSIKKPGRKDVVVIFGGKGIGKSTFLRRLLFHKPTQIIRKNAKAVIVNLLNTPKIENVIRDEIWSQIVNQLDSDHILSSDRDDLVSLFDDHYSIAVKQDLFGLDEKSVEYNTKLNSLVAEWKSDLRLCAKYLAKRTAMKHVAPVIAIDNTDQFGSELQEFCFTVAHEVSDLLSCLVIISMREERFYGSSIHGVLDAFSNSGFHLSAPSSKNVFIKRIQYAIKILSNSSLCLEFLGSEISPADANRLSQFFRTIHSDFVDSSSHLGGFLSACAHGNIRLALELFRGFIRSKYTNVNEITAVTKWTFQIHQVLKPIMMPDRFFYDESQSKIPNIFSLRSAHSSSHFTALRILKFCSSQTYGAKRKFVSMGSVLSEIVDRFSMADDFARNMDMLLQCRMVEANNRVEEYSHDIDKVKITEYGLYMVSTLWPLFTYLELVSVDTPILDPQVVNEISKLSNDEYRLWEDSQFNAHKRVERVECRLSKAESFIKYLIQEERRESEIFGIPENELFTFNLLEIFSAEAQSVRRSAGRQRFG